jgi:hypothetical protein
MAAWNPFRPAWAAGALSLTDGLRTPTGLARDTGTGDLFVTEFGANRIARVLVPR